MRFEGEYLNNIKNGNAKKYSKGELIFEGKYINGERKEGKEYKYSELIFEGEYLNNKNWNGKGKE